MSVKYKWLPLEDDRFKLLKVHSCHAPKKPTNPPPQKNQRKRQNRTSYKEIESNLHIMVGSEYIAKATVFKVVFYYKSVISYTHSWTDNFKVWFWQTKRRGGKQEGHNFSKLAKLRQSTHIPFQICLPPHHLPACPFLSNFPDPTLSGIVRIIWIEKALHIQLNKTKSLKKPTQHAPVHLKRRNLEKVCLQRGSSGRKKK